MMRKLIILSLTLSSLGFCFSQKNESKFYLANKDEMTFVKEFSENCLGITRTKSANDIELIQQGWGELGINRSIVNDSLRIERVTYQHGFGTHANSEIKITLPSKAKRLTAFVGHDNNDQNRGQASSKINFIVVSSGKILWKSKPLSAGDAPEKVDVQLKGATEIRLKAEYPQKQGNWGHADWCNAQAELENGEVIWLDDLYQKIDINKELPFSFLLDGKGSREFLTSWKQTLSERQLSDRILYNLSWTKPDNSFTVTCRYTAFKNHPAVEWQLFFKNTGSINSPVLSQVKTLDMALKPSLKYHKNRWGFFDPLILHGVKGSYVTKYDFMPYNHLVDVDEKVTQTSRGGRPSDKYLPFWNIEYDGNGLVAALGWSGNWTSEFTHIAGKENHIAMKAGMTNLETYLNPGEEISTPSVCLLYWEGADALRGNNLWRRYMKDVVVPKWDGKEPLVLAANGGSATLESVNEANQKKLIETVSGTGAEVYWLDAGWYGNGADGSWGSGRGNWYPEKSKFPNGMRALSDEAQKNGLKFLLWFESETVSPGTLIDREHPEYLIKLAENEGRLLNLGNPEAFKFIIDQTSKSLADWNVDIYRNDFNMDAEPYWKKNDAPGRMGISEIRHIEGLYKFWDELLKRKPNLLIDNCASGGRRLDYELCKRSVPLWRSDVQCESPADLYEMSQNQSYGLNLFLPYNSTGSTIMYDKYKDRSVANNSVVYTLSFLKKNDNSAIPFFAPEKGMGFTPNVINKGEVKKVFDDFKSYNYLISCDYYPLTDFSLKNDIWMVLQYNSPEKGEGCLLCYRRPNAIFNEAEFKLNGIDANAIYKVLYINSGKEEELKGEQLLRFSIRLKQGESEIVKYIKQ